MIRKYYEEMIALLESPDTPEYFGSGNLYNPLDDSFCALGWVGFKRGMTKEDLQCVDLDEDSGKTDAYDRIKIMFGMDNPDLSCVWLANDCTPKELRKSSTVIEKIKRTLGKRVRNS